MKVAVLGRIPNPNCRWISKGKGSTLMRLRLLAISPPPGRGARLAAELGSDLEVVAFEDEHSRDLCAEALFAAVGGPLPKFRRSKEADSKGLHRRRSHGKRPHPIFVLGRRTDTTADDEPGLDYASAYVDYEASDGRSLGILGDLVDGRASVVDLDTNYRIDVEAAPVPGGLTFEVFEALVRVKAPDAQLASGSPDQALRALKKVALSAGLGNLVPDLVDRACDALSGEVTREWSPPLPSVGPVTRLRALELDADESARAERARDHELQTLHAALRRKNRALEDLYGERSRNEYLLLRVRHKRISQRVARIDDLTAQLERLHSEPAPEAAETAVSLAPKVEKLMASLGEARAELSDLLKGVPADRRDVEELERELINVQEELSLLAGTPPVGGEIEKVVKKVYDEWRRLSAEAEAADFAAAQARADAEELAQEPPESIVQLSRVTTAEKLRSRLRARTAVAHEQEAALRRRHDALERVRAKLSERGSSPADAISTARLVRTPIERLALIQDAHEARVEAEKTASLVPRYRFMKRRTARRLARGCAATERWLLAEEGIDTYDALAGKLEEACEVSKILEPLTSATYDVAGISARLVAAEEELSEHADGVSTSDLSSLVDELEAHQSRIAAALEIQREADVATEAARSLRAVRDAAATELLARLRPLGITESDPAMAWSRFRVLAEGWRKKRMLDERLAELSSRLEPYIELRRRLEACRTRQQDLARRLSAVLSQVGGCNAGSLDERIANFARLRDAALLEKKLSAARSHLESRLQAVCQGKPACEWRKELVEVEARLSELEDANPSWKKIEVASPEAVLEEKVSGIAVRIRSAETATAGIEAEIKRLSSEAASTSGNRHVKLADIRGRLRRLDLLAKQCSSLRIDQDYLYIEDSVARPETIPAAVGATASASPAPRSSLRRTSRPRTRPDASRADTPLSAYLLARTALLLGCGPENEQLPLVIDGALDTASPYEKKELLHLLDLVSAATQVVILTADPDVRALARSSGAHVEAL